MSGSNIRCFSDSTQAVTAMSEFVVETIQQSARDIGLCRIALAGGGTPSALYQRLASPAMAHRIDWNALHLFWGDERCVPREDPNSNFGMVKTVLLDHAGIPHQNIHPIDGTQDPEVAAERYADEIADEPFDMILLGLGQDGHTASLFPNTPNLSNERRAVIATTSPLPPRHRVSLSLKTINAARQVAFLVLGSGKSEILAQVLAERDLNEPNLPASMVYPTTGKLIWFVDQEAASKLGREPVAAPARKCPQNGSPAH